MGVVKSPWASIQGDPVFMRRVNGWLTIFWVAMIPISMAMGWLSSVVYVSALSLWALVSGHWSAWQAARVEVKQEETQRAIKEQDLPSDGVKALIDKATNRAREGLTSLVQPLTKLRVRHHQVDQAAVLGTGCTRQA